MSCSAPKISCHSGHSSTMLDRKTLSTTTTYNPICGPVFWSSKSRTYNPRKFRAFSSINECGVSGGVALQEMKPRRVNLDKKPPNLTEEQTMAISQLPSKMTNRCKALMRSIICSYENGNLDRLLASWVKSTKPRRADWLSVLKEMEKTSHPLYFEVFEQAFTHESFEPNIRDYTKIIHAYAKRSMLQNAENALSSLKSRGFVCDQVILTALVHMYSKAGNLELAEQSFNDMKSLGVALDRRSYGSMIMAYIRAGRLGSAEGLLREIEARDVYAGREVYKALLRAYSMSGDSCGAQRVFEAAQLAGLIPDARVCGLLINAYLVSGRCGAARAAFDNMRRKGVVPNDRCVGLVAAAYVKEKRFNQALNLLMGLEMEGVVVGGEALSWVLNWGRKVGIEGVFEEF